MKHIYKNLRIGFISLTVVLLSACVTTNPYVLPPQNQPTATIKGFHSGTGINHFEVARVMQIDGQDNPTSYDYDKEVPVTPGTHSFTIQTVYVHSFWSGRFESDAIVTAKLLAGHRYQVHETSQNNQVNVWITDQNGKTVSAVVSAPTREQRDPLILRS